MPEDLGSCKADLVYNIEIKWRKKDLLSDQTPQLYVSGSMLEILSAHEVKDYDIQNLPLYWVKKQGEWIIWKGRYQDSYTPFVVHNNALMVLARSGKVTRMRFDMAIEPLENNYLTFRLKELCERLRACLTWKSVKRPSMTARLIHKCRYR